MYGRVSKERFEGLIQSAINHGNIFESQITNNQPGLQVARLWVVENVKDVFKAGIYAQQTEHLTD
jgi:hypothetical protein